MEHSRNANTIGKGGKAKGLALCTMEPLETVLPVHSLQRQELLVSCKDTEVPQGPASSPASPKSIPPCLYKGDPGSKKR